MFTFRYLKSVCKPKQPNPKIAYDIATNTIEAPATANSPTSFIITAINHQNICIDPYTVNYILDTTLTYIVLNPTTYTLDVTPPNLVSAIGTHTVNIKYREFNRLDTDDMRSKELTVIIEKDCTVLYF